ncbi:hypothetical protein [Paenibacillus konkukensis]|nr:hypothetical protein [Paenibacillus konkukensis]
MEILKKKIKNGRMFQVFRSQVGFMRRLTAGETEEVRNTFIAEGIALFREACRAVLKCSLCQEEFQFRHCRNPGKAGGTVHAVELACACCGDVFTLAEDRERITYFNSFVMKKVDSLRDRSDRLAVKVCMGGLSEPALLCVYQDDRRPVLWIDVQQFRRPDAVQPYWTQASDIVERLELDRGD